MYKLRVEQLQSVAGGDIHADLAEYRDNLDLAQRLHDQGDRYHLTSDVLAYVVGPPALVIDPPVGLAVEATAVFADGVGFGYDFAGNYYDGVAEAIGNESAFGAVAEDPNSSAFGAVAEPSLLQQGLDFLGF